MLDVGEAVSSFETTDQVFEIPLRQLIERDH
jgi:hypothetical protein